ncbi:tetratricopeptide (TPR) repeat protein [Saccharothrix tamanrassetensis]|uniref:Tetratricopeptide (TPR) repeat protein n=1 Tax=Saccharothrix tamanrassetensis TaxID=1051531 RepID=A0A841CE80_9PSEU|nr:tetratricopeptide repeat protein [Saccharothrix tamanrassetensis]MBB5955581.1 tetratricopeptide (TPR) repeat protein [Saccharothrix tamanrassetensis]
MVEQRNDMSGTVSGALIQARDLALGAQPPVALSGLPPVDVFTGRAEALASLAEALRPADDTAPVVLSAVAGLAGVGKTTLAVRAAHDAVAAGWFPGGALFIDLRGYDPNHRVTPDGALSTFLRALGVPAEHLSADRAGREALYRSMLAGRDAVLVVLDNASSADQVRPLLPNAPAHRVLVTSRHTLADLTGARLLDLNVLTDTEAVALVDAAVRAAGPDDDRVTPETAAELVRLCGRLPLALGIVAAILAGDPELPVGELVDALGNASTRLGELAYGDSAGVRAAFDLSYHRLSPAEARLFRLLSLDPGRQIGVPAAAALADLPERDTAKLLANLRRAHMVEPGEPRGWFRYHDLLRLYAEERARDESERDAALERLFDYYVAATEEADAQRAPTQFISRDAVAWLDTEGPTLVENAVRAAETGHHRHALRLVLAMSRYLFYRRHWDDCEVLFPLALEMARRIGDRTDEVRALRRLGKLAREQRRHDDAREHYTAYLAISRELDDQARVAQALHNLGSIARRVRDLDVAQAHYDEALARYRELGDWRGETDILFNLGTVSRHKRRFPAAHTYYSEAMALAVEHGDVLREARVCLFLGILAARERKSEAARHWWTLAVELYEKLGDGDMVRSIRKRLNRIGRRARRLAD